MDEVTDPSLSVLAEGFFNGGPKSYILNKIEDTYNLALLFVGQRKNNINKFKMYFHTRVRAASRIGPHDQDVISVIIGSLLGDCYANNRSVEGTRLCYRQSIIHKDYLFWLYKFYYDRGYCSNLEPRVHTIILKKGDKKTEHFRYEFNTFTFRSFNWIHKMFYKKGKKYIHPEIENYLTPLALAIWIMSSPTKYLSNKQLIIFTTFKEKKDRLLLVNLFFKRFGLNCTDDLHKDRDVIIITKESVKKLQTLVAPFILPSLSHKVGLNYKNILSSPSLLYGNKLVAGYRYYSGGSKHNSNSIVVSYSDPFEIRSLIYKENKNKAGVYRWTYLITGKTYIGSSANLANRFSDYFSTYFLTREASRTKSIIYASLLKNGYSNFKLEILEYCDSTEVIAREQYYLDLYLPEYNILKIAGSTLGYKHTEETLAKFKQRKLSKESLEKLQNHLAILNPRLNKEKRIEVFIFDFDNNEDTLYPSIIEAAEAIGTDTKTIWEKSKTNVKAIIPFKGRYVITKLSEGQTKQDHLKRIELAKPHLDKGGIIWKNALGKKVIVSNIVTNEIVVYNTISEAAIALNTSRPTIVRRMKDKKPFNNTYLIYEKQ